MGLEETYLNPEHPGSFGGVEALHRALKGQVKRGEIKRWLEMKDSYTLHKPVRHKFRRNRVIAKGINDQFQADLVDMQSLSKYNNGFKYLLTCIDVFSKRAWAIPLRNKSGKSVLSAFKIIFQERKPKYLQTDKGTEFKNETLQKYLKQQNIKFFTTNNETKACIVERFNRSLRGKMWKYFTEFNTYNYIDVIDRLIQSYNNTWHRSIKMTPAEVNDENQNQVWYNLYGKLTEPPKSEFKVGDTVRISKKKLLFEKGYEANWTREIFTIHKIIYRNPIVFNLKDLTGEILEGTFYREELQKVADNGFYPVEKVLKKRKKKDGKVEYFVKFLGYPEKFNSWVSNVRAL